jgi:large conductance mechanosensitive channel
MPDSDICGFCAGLPENRNLFSQRMRSFVKTGSKKQEEVMADENKTALQSGKDAAAAQMKNAGGLLKEFKEFISRGNVLDMAVGVIIGGAFTAIVTSLVEDIFTPIIGMVLVGINFKSLGITIPWGNHPYINFGSFIESLITFLLTALCLFVIIKLINSFKRKEAPKPAEDPKPTKDQELLTEIRDLLKAQAKE